MNFNSQDFIFNNSLIQTVSLQRCIHKFCCCCVLLLLLLFCCCCLLLFVCLVFVLFLVMCACMRVYVWVGVGLWMWLCGRVTGWSNLKMVWTFFFFKIFFQWKYLAEMCRTFLIAHWSYYFKLEPDVIYQIWIYLITIPRHNWVVTLPN